MMNNSQYNRYVIIGAFISLLLVAAWIIKPYFVVILTSAVIAYIFYPVYKWLNKKIKRPSISALIITFFLILVIIIPLIISANVVTKEAYLIYLSGKNRLATDVFQSCDNSICELVKAWSSDVRTKFYIQEALENASTYVIEGISSIVLSIPRLVIDLLIASFVVFYLFKDGHLFIRKLDQIFHLPRKQKSTITKRLDDVMYAVVYGNIIIALIQGAIGALSFWIFGVSSPIIWGVIMAILSFAPYVGTGMIWIPASLIFIYDGVSTNESMLIFKGVGIFFVNLVAGGTADNILKPKIIGSRSCLHPALILIGIFGGISLLGVAGFIIGPIILAMAVTFIDLYISQNNH